METWQKTNVNRLQTPWLGKQRGYLVDWLTQRWVQYTGRSCSLKDEPWLDGPYGETSGIGKNYFDLLAQDEKLLVSLNKPESGLLPDFSNLGSYSFQPSQVHPRIIDFYEHTSGYRLNLWAEWCGVFRPFGWLITWIFSRRLQQLNMPLTPLETSHGVSSDIIQLIDPATTQIRMTGWLRTFLATGEVIYAGIYSISRPKHFKSNCVKVVFPLPNGNATVFLNPVVEEDGSLKIISKGKGFGEPGFYFLVKKNTNTVWVKYLHVMTEMIHVYVNDREELHADHVFKIWGLVFLKMHYSMIAVSESN